MINTNTNICNLIIPKFNLITNDDNYSIYFTKLSDEFTRYNKTKLILFNSSNFISFNNIKYNINENEVILMESVLAEEITSTGLQIKDPYSNYTTFDTYNIKSSSKINKVDTSKITTEYDDFDLDKIQPDEKVVLKLPKKQVEKIKLLEKKYLQEKRMEEGLVELEEDLPPVKENLNDIEETIDEYVKSIQCKHKKNAIKELELNKLFKNRVYEFYFDIDSNKQCSFELLLFILKNYYSNSSELNLSEIDILHLKNLLIEEYFNNEYTEAFVLNNLQINKKLVENSSSIGNIIKTKLKTSPFLKTQEFKLLLSQLINSPDFYVTYMDIYLIAKRFNLPIILMCNTIINLSITEKTFIILNKNTQNNNYYFIKVPSNYHRGIKNYKLLYFHTSSTINIKNDLVNSDKIQFETEILLELDNYKDLILNSIINFDSKKVAPKNKKLIKKK
tara:strand:- start:625 stop:1965 length:1341 start_codon:yes stop_codon:yes gene_type:complete